MFRFFADVFYFLKIYIQLFQGSCTAPQANFFYKMTKKEFLSKKGTKIQKNPEKEHEKMFPFNEKVTVQFQKKRSATQNVTVQN